jgi:uncharacterized RDD family membrane protein YckC
MPRFDEIELQLEAVPFEAAAVTQPGTDTAAPRLKRLAALLIDLSLFAALALALSPLLPTSRSALALGALAGFVVVVSYYYYAGSWLLWGKTIGGAIFDVRVVPSRPPAMSLKSATLRWLGLSLSLATGGLGFLLAALPSRLSLADRISRTKCVAG